MPSTAIELGARLRQARRAKNISQATAAHALGVSQAFISQLERGLLPDRLFSLVNYAEFVSLDTKALLADLATVCALQSRFRDFETVARLFPSAVATAASERVA